VRNPNGYGSVVRLSGNRRRPYAARKTKGFDGRGYPIYFFIGYYQTREEGLIALAEYNKNPYSTENGKITVKELYEKWALIKMPRLGEASQLSLRSAARYLTDIEDLKYRDLRSFHMQSIIDNCGKSYSTQGAIKTLFVHLDRFAMELDVISKRYSELLIIEPIPETSRLPFSDEEISQLWAAKHIPCVDLILIMLYSGWRIGELLRLQREDIDPVLLTMKGGIKTSAGKGRIVPIHPRIEPLIMRHYAEGGKYLFMREGKPFTKSQFYPIWRSIMKSLQMAHTPHECRHTFRSRLDSAGANKVCIDLMMGQLVPRSWRKDLHA